MKLPSPKKTPMYPLHRKWAAFIHKRAPLSAFHTCGIMLRMFIWVKYRPKSGLSRTILYKGSRVGSQQRDAFQKSRGHGTSSTPDLEFSLIEFSSCEFFASLRPDWALNGFTTGNGGGLVGRAPSKPDWWSFSSIVVILLRGWPGCDLITLKINITWAMLEQVLLVFVKFRSKLPAFCILFPYPMSPYNRSSISKHTRNIRRLLEG